MFNFTVTVRTNLKDKGIDLPTLPKAEKSYRDSIYELDYDSEADC